MMMMMMMMIADDYFVIQHFFLSHAFHIIHYISLKLFTG